MKLVVFAVMLLGTFAADPKQKAPEEKGQNKPAWKTDSETAKKFDDLGKQTRNITSNWKRYPHRQNRSNETSAALRGQFQGKNVSFCGRKMFKIPMKFRYMWTEKPLTEDDILGSPQQRDYNAWHATHAAPRSGSMTLLQKKGGLRGPGADQTLASGGAIGEVAGSEPFATTLKDGYWPVGCYTDKMLTTADKFGDEKDNYKNAADVSIANYDDLLDSADHKPMTPEVCFEFCSTIPDMVFFGITEGRTCYCTPYFHPGPGDGSKCDAVCEGDTTLMCGSTSGRSSMFEMHLCGGK